MTIKYDNHTKVQAEMLIEMIESIIISMEKSKQKKLEMEDWVYVDDTASDDVKPFSCGYAACVIGDHVIRTEGIDFPILAYKSTSIAISCNKVTKRLRELATFITGENGLAHSIYNFNPIHRYHGALTSGLFESGEVENYRHLMVDYPTPKDVVIYLKAINENLLNKVINSQ